jgi:hypothetical protein
VRIDDLAQPVPQTTSVTNNFSFNVPWWGWIALLIAVVAVVAVLAGAGRGETTIITD